MKRCKWCNREFADNDGHRLGGHQTNCQHRPLNLKEQKLRKVSNSLRGKKLSFEHRRKISESRKRFLLENPEMVPYKLNHKHKETYPEKYFKSVLTGFVCQYRPEGTAYEIDFANPSRKIAIEIDGEQHYVDPRIVEHDKVRTNILLSMGWSFVRIRWSDFQSRSFEEKQEIVKNIMSYSMGDFELIHYRDYKR